MSLADYGMEDLAHELNVAAARLAREAADEFNAQTPDGRASSPARSARPRKTASISPDVNDPGFRNITFDELVAAYTRSAARADRRRRRPAARRDDLRHAERQGGALRDRDVFERAACACRSSFRARSPTPRAARCRARRRSVLELGAHARPLAIGLNCALGAKDDAAVRRRALGVADAYVCCYPNAGLPNALRRATTRRRSTRRACCGEFARAGFLNLVGGCCGTTPAHIARDRRRGARHRAAQRAARSRSDCGSRASSR